MIKEEWYSRSRDNSFAIFSINTLVKHNFYGNMKQKINEVLDNLAYKAISAKF